MPDMKITIDCQNCSRHFEIKVDQHTPVDELIGYKCASCHDPIEDGDRVVKSEREIDHQVAVR
jgi:hypothetical protein